MCVTQYFYSTFMASVTFYCILVKAAYSISADPRLLGALRKTVSPAGGGGVLRNGWNAFVRVSLRLESCSRKALEKQYLFAVRFQLFFFFSLSNKRLYDIHVTRFLHRERDSAPH